MEIYGLSDPETGELRYVGKTETPLEFRLERHQQPSNLRADTHKNRWLKILLDRGSRPVIHSIQVLDKAADLTSAEIYWIAFFRAQGCRLTNGTDGGEGATGARRSPETRAKMAAAATGRKHVPESLIKMSAAKKGGTLSPEHREKISAAGKVAWVARRTKNV